MACPTQQGWRFFCWAKTISNNPTIYTNWFEYHFELPHWYDAPLWIKPLKGVFLGTLYLRLLLPLSTTHYKALYWFDWIFYGNLCTLPTIIPPPTTRNHIDATPFSINPPSATITLHAACCVRLVRLQCKQATTISGGKYAFYWHWMYFLQKPASVSLLGYKWSLSQGSSGRWHDCHLF